MNRQLVYVGFAFQHHKGTHAGYHQIKNYINYNYIIDCQSYYEKSLHPYSSLIGRLKCAIQYRLLGYTVFPWYIFRVLWLGITHDNLIFHFIYGENIFCPWIKKFIRKRNVIVCTLHQPFAYFQTSNKTKKIVRLSDYIILVANTEIEQFKEMTGKDNVYYIPHGVSTDFYKTDTSIKKEHMLLTVGNWLRDYKFANDVYLKLLGIDNLLEIYVVTNASNRTYISNNPRIHFYTGITDEQLLLLYQKSAVLFLPLTKYTANNALLEAGAAGCNIVISSNYTDTSYVPTDLITITRMDIDTTITSVRNAMSGSYNMNLSKYVTDNYNWVIIGNLTQSFLLRLC